MASSRKRRRLDYNPSDPDIPLGPLNLQEMLLFPNQVWNRMMNEGPGHEARSALFAYYMSFVHAVCLDISDLLAVSINNFIVTGSPRTT